MADLRTLALQTEASISAFLAAATAAGSLWPADEKALQAALVVARQHTSARQR